MFKNWIDEAAERTVVAYAVEYPSHDQHLTNNELRKSGIYVLCSSVLNVVTPPARKIKYHLAALDALQTKITS